MFETCLILRKRPARTRKYLHCMCSGLLFILEKGLFLYYRCCSLDSINLQNGLAEWTLCVTNSELGQTNKRPGGRAGQRRAKGGPKSYDAPIINRLCLLERTKNVNIFFLRRKVPARQYRRRHRQVVFWEQSNPFKTETITTPINSVAKNTRDSPCVDVKRQMKHSSR